MSIAFPRSFPNSFRFGAGSYLDLKENVELSPTAGATTYVKELGDPVWVLTVKSGLLFNQGFADITAWRSTLAGGKTFWGYDPLRPYPFAYRFGLPSLTRATGGGFDWTCQIDGVSSDSVLIGLKLLPAGLVLSVGDYLSFAYGASGKQALHKVVVGSTAGSDGRMTVEVRPSLKVGWSIGATVNLARPSAKMFIVPNSWAQDTQVPDFGTVSFQAQQQI